jgi:phage terminase large subunit GpA-like protein
VAWGRGEESWRVYWGEIYGNVSTSDAVWTELERFLFRPYRHASGAELTSRRRRSTRGRQHVGRRVRVLPQAPPPRRDGDQGPRDGEIFRVPQPIDPGRKTKAARYGLHVYQVGTEKAKDLLIGFGEHGGRLRLSEQREGRRSRHRPRARAHALVSRHPRRLLRAGHLGDQGAEEGAAAQQALLAAEESGVRNEALDCEVYALHASRRIKINLMTEAQWQAIEEKLRQPDLIGAAQPSGATDTPVRRCTRGARAGE